MERSRHRRLALAVLLGLLPAAAGPATAASGPIAFVTPSRDSTEIRLIAPDGSRLAFTSSHDWRRSLHLRDVYVIDRAGGPLLRPSLSPDPSAYAGFPQGSVKVRVRTIHAGDSTVFVEGAAAPAELFARQNAWQEVVIDEVADFGEGVRQQVRVYHRVEGFASPCWQDQGVFADVRPGETVEAGELSSLHGYHACPLAIAADWLDDRRLALIFRESVQFEPHNVWAVSADAPPGPADWERLLDLTNTLEADSLVDLDVGPAGGAADGQVALLANSGRQGSIMVGPADDLGLAEWLDIGQCADITCALLGIAWRPDGGGLFMAQQENPSATGVLYELDLASGERRELLRLPGEVIGRLAVAPDGETIAFERAGRIGEDLVQRATFGVQARCPCAIWLIERDGSNLRELVADARAPAWAP